MQTSVFLARLVGPVMLVVGLSLFINRSRFQQMAREFLERPALLFLTGLLVMPAGLAIVLTHNVWSADWRMLITLFGWLTAIGGALRLVAPHLTIRAGQGMLKQPRLLPIAGGIWVAMGLLFCFVGYLH